MKKVLSVIAVLVVIALGLAVSAGISTYVPKTSYYIVKNEKLDRDFRVAQLSDLHGAEFGEDNEKLTNSISLLRPELIVLTGDIISEDADDDEIDMIASTIKSLKATAPVYYCYGDTEKAYINANGDGLTKTFKKAGAVILNNNYKDITIEAMGIGKEQKLRIGGCNGMLYGDDVVYGDEQQFMQHFQKTDLFKLLLDFNPTGLLDYGTSKNWDFDAALCGFTHGGQVRFPLLGGIINPNGGFMPDYDKGKFEMYNSTIIVSSGLGSNSVIPPRINNMPEIVCVDFQTK